MSLLEVLNLICGIQKYILILSAMYIEFTSKECTINYEDKLCKNSEYQKNERYISLCGSLSPF